MNDYHIKNIDQYYEAYKKSIRDPENFWEDIDSHLKNIEKLTL